jgi:hypothetical protein
MKSSLILMALLFSFSAMTAKAQVSVKLNSCIELTKTSTTGAKKASQEPKKVTLDQLNNARVAVLAAILGVGYGCTIYRYFQSPLLSSKILGGLHCAHLGIIGIMAVKAYLLSKKQKDGRRRITA